jgi:hypothetical protein
MSRGTFTAIKTEGGLLPREVLERIAAGDPDLPGTGQDTYHIPPNERIGERINRAWNRLLGLWEAYSHDLKARGEGDAATGLTRDRWLLPLFDELGFGRLQRSTAIQIERKSFAISHMWERTPIHLVGAGVSIDRRVAVVAGAAAAAPHGLVQEFLNRSDAHLWAFVSNGRLLRILRDNHSLSRQAYVEFDLEAIMNGELFSDFRVLWLVCHQSRVEAGKPEECWLETWFQKSREEGVRALDALRVGVEKAIEAFGAGFLRHPANGRLHEGFRSSVLDRQDYYRELLRLVYRLIFLFVAEDRDALLDPNASQEARQRYTKFYASTRLRELAGRRRGTAHDDLWRGLRLVLSKLHDGSPELGLPALGSFLWSEEAVESIGDAELRNDDLLAALRALCYTTQDHQLLPVNWRTLGSEELGSVYESLLELHPKMNREAGTFELDTAAGHERKTTGSYYTPTSLVDRLLDSALEPVLEEAMRADDPEAALLELKVCDTAAGSGHFLVAAARRIALRLASVRTGDEEASPEAVTHALRDVVGRCIYGVDLNPLAVELCKVSLWMEALEPGKPLSFLDHHIQLGNSLLGTTPHLLAEGIPNEAFKDIEGDDHDVVIHLRARNRQERDTEQIGFHTQMMAEPGARYGGIDTLLDDLNRADDSTLEAVRLKEARYQRLLDDPRYRTERLAADAWCAAFVWRKTETGPLAITEEVFRQIQRKPDSVPASIAMEVRGMSERYRFFHFHIAFPNVFRAVDGETGANGSGLAGGFDVILGNPPWEAEELIEREFFASRAPEIAAARTKADREELLASLADDDPELYAEWREEKRLYAARVHLARNSGLYPLGGAGKVNTYRLFAELNARLVNPRGRVGTILKSGIINAQDSLALFGAWVSAGRVHSVIECINTEGIFPAVVSNERFCLLTIGGTDTRFPVTSLVFGATTVHDLRDDNNIVIDSTVLPLLNPNDLSIPPVADQRALDLLSLIHSRFGILFDEGGGGSSWGIAYTQGHLNSATGSRLFKNNTAEALEDRGIRVDSCLGCIQPDGSMEGDWLPLYEGKFIAQCNHRFGTFEGVPENRRFGIKAETRDPTPDELQDPWYEIQPRYWVKARDAEVLFRKKGTLHSWLFAFRDVCRGIVDARTVQACVLPRFPCVDGAPLLVFDDNPSQAAKAALFFNVLWASFVFDFVARQKIPGSHLTKAIAYQLPIPTPQELTQRFLSDSYWEFLLPRALELTVVTYSLTPVAEAIGADCLGPFRWDESRRFLLRCECDAVFFHLYGVDRANVDYILDSFPIVRRRELASHGEYRTKRVILEMYDQMAVAMTEEAPYVTHLDPGPADTSVAHSLNSPAASLYHSRVRHR